MGLDKVLFFLIARHNQYSKENVAKNYNIIMSFISRISWNENVQGINFTIPPNSFEDLYSLKYKIDQISKKYIYDLKNESLKFIKNVLNESSRKISSVKELEIPKQLYNAIDTSYSNLDVIYGAKLFECEDNIIRAFSSPDEERYLQFSIAPWEKSIIELMKKFDVPEKYLK